MKICIFELKGAHRVFSIIKKKLFLSYKKKAFLSI